MSKKKRRGKPQQPKLDYEAIRERDAERKKKRREKNREDIYNRQNGYIK